MDVQAQLEEWKLAHLWPLFEEQKIDEIEILKNIQEDQLDFFTKNKMGDRIRLKRGIEGLKQPSEPSFEPPEKKAKDGEGNVMSSKMNEGNLEDSNMMGESIVDGQNEQYTETQHQSFQDLPILFIQTDGEQSELTLPSTSMASTITVDSDLDTSFNSCDQLKPEVRVSHEFDLESLLNQDIIGAAIHQKSKSKLLGNQDREKLSSIIITHFVNTFKKMDHEQFDMLSDQIVKLMPNEKKSTYFINAVKKKESRENKSERARGKLVEKYRNRLHLLRTIQNNIEDEKKSDNNPKIDITRDAQDSHIWLKNNTEPPDDVLHHWKVSHPLRQIGKSQIDEYLQEWPVLKTYIAPELVNYDFEQIHSLSEVDVEKEFQDLFNRVSRIKGNCLNATDSTITELLESELTTDSKIAIQLHLLPSLVPQREEKDYPTKKIGNLPLGKQGIQYIFM